VFGDAIAPRGGEVALSDLISLLAGLGVGPGVVRTAVSRLSADGWFEGAKAGRLSFYRITRGSEQEFAAAEPRIYGPLDRAWDGLLRLAFPAPGADRSALEEGGFAVLAPGVLASPDGTPGALHVTANGPPDALRALAARAWPVEKLGVRYRAFVERFAGLTGATSALQPAAAMAARALLIHDYRRIVLRDPRLPAGLLPDEWPGHAARDLCIRLYGALAPASECWLDAARNRSGPLPRGPDPSRRFIPAPAGDYRRR